MRHKNCLYCGLPESDIVHNRESRFPEGWHLFRGLDYLEGLEDAILFARENKTHQWKETGIVIDTNPSFPEKRCAVCGAVNWGGHENGVCFGNSHAESALVAAHNRRAVKHWTVKS